MLNCFCHARMMQRLLRVSVLFNAPSGDGEALHARRTIFAKLV